MRLEASDRSLDGSKQDGKKGAHWVSVLRVGDRYEFIHILIDME